MKRWLILTVLTVVALAQPPLRLTQADNHKTFQIEKGQQLSLQLPVNPTQGLAWELHYKNSQLKPVGKPVYTPTQPKKPKLGGSVRYTWEAAGDFEDSLELRYVRSDPKQKVPPTRTFLIHLRTGPPSH